MTDDQKRAIRILAGCRLRNRFQRARVTAWATLLPEDPGAELPAIEAHAVMRYLHVYRRQHRQCRCRACFGTAMARLTQPAQFGLFDGGADS